MKDKIFIFGHKNPDTDSVCSAISLSYLKNATGFDTEPRILSNINEETKYVLNKFKIKVPEILKKLQRNNKTVSVDKIRNEIRRNLQQYVEYKGSNKTGGYYIKK